MDWLRKAILGAGGFKAVSAAAGISEPHLYSLCRVPGQAGYRRLNSSMAAKLAVALPKVPKRYWRDALLGGLFTTHSDASGRGKARVTGASA